MSASRPWSALEIEVKMREVIEEQEDATAILKALGMAAAQARREFKRAEAMAWLQVKQDKSLTSDKMRAAWVYLQVDDLSLARDTAEVQYEAQKSIAFQLQSEADTLRSLNKSARDVTMGPGFGYGDAR